MGFQNGAQVAGTPYVASKFAVLGLSENLQHELELAGEPIGFPRGAYEDITVQDNAHHDRR